VLLFLGVAQDDIDDMIICPSDMSIYKGQCIPSDDPRLQQKDAPATTTPAAEIPPCKPGVTCVSPLAVNYVNNKRVESAYTVPYDGKFDIGCFEDDSPESMWIKYHTTMKALNKDIEDMSPEVCFNFCRDKPQARFFGLVHGDLCYCTPFPILSHNSAVGDCTSPCQGDPGTFCGGPVKATIYEMHRSGDLTGDATKDRDDANDLVDQWEFKTGRWQYVVSAITSVSSIVAAADIRRRLQSLASTLEQLRADTVEKLQDLKERVGNLTTSLDAFDSENATSTMMQEMEAAQEKVSLFQAALEDSAQSLQTYWDDHNLDGALAFRAVDSQALGDREILDKKLPKGVNYLPRRVMEEIDCDEDPTDGCDRFPHKLGYFVDGEHITALFQVYNPSKPIEGRPKLKTVEDWRQWTIRECWEMCLMTPGCVAGNVLGSSAEEMYGLTCNLKSSVSTVHVNKDANSSLLVTGFVFNSYLAEYRDEIKYNTAAVTGDDAEEQPDDADDSGASFLSVRRIDHGAF